MAKSGRILAPFSAKVGSVKRVLSTTEKPKIGSLKEQKTVTTSAATAKFAEIAALAGRAVVSNDKASADALKLVKQAKEMLSQKVRGVMGSLLSGVESEPPALLISLAPPHLPSLAQGSNLQKHDDTAASLMEKYNVSWGTRISRAPPSPRSNAS